MSIEFWQQPENRPHQLQIQTIVAVISEFAHESLATLLGAERIAEHACYLGIAHERQNARITMIQQGELHSALLLLRIRHRHGTGALIRQNIAVSSRQNRSDLLGKTGIRKIIPIC